MKSILSEDFGGDKVDAIIPYLHQRLAVFLCGDDDEDLLDDYDSPINDFHIDDFRTDGPGNELNDVARVANDQEDIYDLLNDEEMKGFILTSEMYDEFKSEMDEEPEPEDDFQDLLIEYVYLIPRPV